MKPNPDRIAAYLAGDLSPEEATAFECEMETNPALRAEVESTRGVLGEVRAWMQADAPGSERVTDLIPPAPLPHDLIPPTPFSRKEKGEWKVPSPCGRGDLGVRWGKRENTGVRWGGWRYALQALAACLIFYLGYTLGTATTAPPTFEELSPPPQQVAHVPQVTPAPIVVPTAIDEPTPAPPKAEPVQKPVRTQTVDERGRVMIQTTLAGSTSRAVWVVDGNFRLEQPGS